MTLMLTLLSASSAALAMAPQEVRGTYRRATPVVVQPPAPTAVVAQPAYRAPIAQPYVATTSIDVAIDEWRRLRQSEGYPFATYARFILANPGFPGEAGLRRSA
jgi:soluble lytic murein transglycosylase